jgi:ABC-2 type transport system permease protein
MKIILKIAKNELRYLFYSPIAWFVLIVFIVVCACFFAPSLYDYANAQEVMLKSPQFKGFKDSLTWKIFMDSGVFLHVTGNLYLFVPILTMGLINRETQAGSIRLLYSSPVTVRQIVLGKFLGIMLYNLLLVSSVVLFMGIGVVTILHVDYGMLLSAALGFYLVVCAYSAIGLFMSSLSSYPVVSALATFVIIFILSSVGGLWQKYDVIRDLTWFLSFQNRVVKMLSGLITTRDVIYFIAVSWMFIGFTVIKLRSGREARPWYVKTGRYAGVLAITLLVGYVSSRPLLTGYWDTTDTQRNTIPGRLQEIVKATRDSAVTVTLYSNLLGRGLQRGLPEARNADYLADMWEPYLRFNPDIGFHYEYYYDNDARGTDSALYKQYGRNKSLEQIAGDFADRMDGDVADYKTPEQMHQAIDLRREDYRLVMQVQYKGRKEFLRTFDDTKFWPDVANVAAAFKRLQEPDKIPRIYFVSGELERSIDKTGEREYAFHTAAKSQRGALINIGFDVDTINLALQDIPGDASALVLADPKMDLAPAVRQKLGAYIKAGGNMLVMGEPGKQFVLNPILRQLGIQLMNGELVQPSYDETPDKVLPEPTTACGELYEGLSFLRTGKSDIKGLMPGVTALTGAGDSGFMVKPLLVTESGKTWLKAGDLVVDSTLPPYDPAAGDLRDPAFTTSLQLTRKVGSREQRIIVCGDADFAGNMRFAMNNWILIPFYSWLTYNRYPVYLPVPGPKDTLLTISEKQAGVLKIVTIWILPGLIVLLGTLLLIRRKRK